MIGRRLVDRLRAGPISTRSVDELVCSGICDIHDLREAVSIAMRLEFATIPPYLCAQWSIKDDPDRLEGVLHAVASQEMSHMAMAGNLLSAIGGAVRVATPGFVVRYPVQELPGRIRQQRAIDLRPLDREQLAVFMQIEQPSFPPVALRDTRRPATIGDFYDALIEGFERLKPPINPDAHMLPVFDVSPIRSLPDAIRVLEQIRNQGEGLIGSPVQPSSHRGALAHYYAFKEIHRGRRLVEIDGKWTFSGERVTLPSAYEFRRTCRKRRLQRLFSATFTDLLRSLELSWTKGTPVDVAAMLRLKSLGIHLIRQGIAPQFSWQRWRCHTSEIRAQGSR